MNKKKQNTSKETLCHFYKKQSKTFKVFVCYLQCSEASPVYYELKVRTH